MKIMPCPHCGIDLGHIEKTCLTCKHGDRWHNRPCEFCVNLDKWEAVAFLAVKEKPSKPKEDPLHLEKTNALDTLMSDLGFVVPIKGFLSYDLTTIKNIFNEIRHKVSLIEDLNDEDEELKECEERVRELEEKLESFHSKEK